MKGKEYLATVILIITTLIAGCASSSHEKGAPPRQSMQTKSHRPVGRCGQTSDRPGMVSQSPGTAGRERLQRGAQAYSKFAELDPQYVSVSDTDSYKEYVKATEQMNEFSARLETLMQKWAHREYKRTPISGHTIPGNAAVFL